MNRFDLDLEMCFHAAQWPGEDSYHYWKPSDKDRALIEWLSENVGQCVGSSYRLPMRGNGWFICEGFDGDPKLDDYSWRYVMGLRYKPQGLFGIWLEVEDDEAAVQLRLNGKLDGVQWTAERPHKYSATSQWRSMRDHEHYPGRRR